MNHPIKAPKKLIEVALPLDAINAAATKEKNIRHGHPSTLHLWWARRPLATVRAVIFAQLVNDPGYQQGGGFRYGKNKKEAALERKRLFKIIEDLVKWENTTNEEVLDAARAEIRRSWREVCELNKDHPRAAELFDPENLPALHDPFAGGGGIPIEAQRLGLHTFASDLNPIAVLLNKAMIEIPPRFAGRAPVGPLQKDEPVGTAWPAAAGLAEDVRRYGVWMRFEAERRIGHLYPKVEITAEMARERPDLNGLVGQKLTVISWLWARTVRSPNPAFSQVAVPLAATFVLSSKEGKEVYVQPIIGKDQYQFTIKIGKPPATAQEGTKASGRGASFRCLMCNVAIGGDYIKAEGQAGRMGARLMAMVAEGPPKYGRVYLSPTEEMEQIARSAQPSWSPSGEVPSRLTGGTCVPYGLKQWRDLFTARQLVALTTFNDLVAEVHDRIKTAALAAGMSDDETRLEAGGAGAIAYADAVCTYLGLSVSKETIFLVTQARWRAGEGKSAPAFGRQAVPMVWDYAELNPFAGAGGDWLGIIDGAEKSLRGAPAFPSGFSVQADAAVQDISAGKIISTDPPYYNNINYADLADYFYVWLRKSLRPIYPSLFATLAVPKEEELVAVPSRHGGADKAEAFFMTGMTQAMMRVAEQAHPGIPVTIYYAYKQAETESDGTSSTGWETFLEALIRAGLWICGTWPLRTEGQTRLIGMGTNALASSIILVCHKRAEHAATVSRRELLRELDRVLPEALDELTKGSGDDRSPVAPVDLSQAIIGPGMAVYSRYSAVLEADGSRMTVRTALQMINRFLVEDDFDNDTQFCLHWFEQNGWGHGAFAEADVLARDKATGVNGLVDTGVIHLGHGTVSLRRPNEYPANWDPRTDKRTAIWELLHQLIRALRKDGEVGAGQVLGHVKAKGEAIRQLAYRLYTLCERRGWAKDARAYNELVTSWPGIELAAGSVVAVSGEGSGHGSAAQTQPGRDARPT